METKAMFIFDMTLDQSFASFSDPDTDKMVFIDSFDNRSFNVRYGTLTASVDVGTIVADSDASLNEQLKQLIEKQDHGNFPS
jgi:hypothetical protein